MRKMLKMIAAYINRRMAEEFGFVLWVPEYRKMHHAMKIQDLREWVQCYPQDAMMYVYHKGELL